jgi:tricorn protease
MKPILLFVFLGLLASNPGFCQQKGYYRSPSIYQNLVVFSAEGDLWKFDRTTGIALRLTTHAGVETRPCISADGKQIVFTGQFEGVTELYLMGINGGVPKRLTYNFDEGTRPLGWTSEGKIIYQTSKFNLLPDRQLVTLDPVTLSFDIIPLAEGSDGCYDPSGMLFFTRLPKQSSNNKRYMGGTIQQIWKFDGKQEASCLTCDFDGTSYSPMIYKEEVYFLSDRDGTMNIWSMDKGGKSLKQHTFSKGWDIMSASLSGADIAYQKGADIWIYNIESAKETLLDITLQSDFDQRKPRWMTNLSSSISFSSFSPDGNFLSILSRGRVFDVPVKGDRWVEVIRKSGIRVEQSHFLSDKTLAFTSDQSGEIEIWKMASDGSGTPSQLTKNSKVLITDFLPSPDGKLIAYLDKNEVLRIIDSSDAQVKFEYQDKEFGLRDISWSSDGRFLTFSHFLENQNAQISVVEIATGKINALTTTRLNSYSASWSKDGHWLYFLSDRNLSTKVRSPWGARAPEPYYTEATEVFALQLDSSSKFPFYQDDPWILDTASAHSSSADSNPKSANKPPAAASQRSMDWQSALTHLFPVPVKNGNLSSLSVAEGWLYWIDHGTATAGGSAKLMALKIEQNKKNDPVEISSGVDDYELSANKKKILITKGNVFFSVDANGSKLDPEKDRISMNNWAYRINPVQDWNQMFTDAWRMMRDYYYDPGMQHVDWAGVKKKYEALLERVTDRDELDDLLAQMVSELSTLHTFVYGGDKRRSPDHIAMGFLGAAFQMDPKGMKLTRIYKSDPDYPQMLSPLAKPNLTIKEGDIITQINDQPIADGRDIFELLENKVDMPVKLTLLNKNQAIYTQIVHPISSGDENQLRYSDWELSRRESVDQESQEQIGYIHLRAMGTSDMDAFVKQYYPVFTRKGLIIDVRHNRGGNIDSWILEKLIRKAWFYWKGRTGKPYWNMQYAFRGHIVVLCDQFTASDGEAFTEGFKRLGIGKAIGMRTWGGEIWLRSDNTLVDNGIATAAEMGVFGPEGKWLIEGRGVEPDYVIDNLPHETFMGKDAQLDFAIDYLKKLIEKEPVEDPKVPAYPDKSFKYNAN